MATLTNLNTTAQAAPKRELRHRDYVTVFTKYHWMGGALGMAAGSDSVISFSKIKPKEEKGGVLYFPYVAYFDLVLHSRFKTKRLLRSDIDKSTDKSTDKMTTVTLWRMCAEGY